MLNYSDREHSFEYNPLPTEMKGKDSQKNLSISSNKCNSIIRYSQVFNEQIEKKESNRASLNLNNQSKSTTSLHSLRESHSISDMNDNERTLLEKMNIINPDEAISVFHTPIKHKSTKIYIDNVFDYSSTDNKSIIISELDIQISASNINTNNQNYNIANKTNSNATITRVNTNTQANANVIHSNNSSIQDRKTKENVKTVDTMKLYKVNTVKSTKMTRIYKDINNINKPPLSEMSKKQTKQQQSLLKYTQEYQTNSRPQFNRQNSTKVHKTLSRSSCDSEKKSNNKKQIIYSSMKKLANQISIFDLIFKMSEEKNETPKAKQKYHYMGQSSYSTASQETKKKFTNSIPTTQLKKTIRSHCLNQKESLMHNKLCSIKHSPKKQNNLFYGNQITKRDYSLNEGKKGKKAWCGFRNTTISNSGSTSKNYNNKNTHTHSKPFLHTHLNVFHTHQSIIDSKIQSFSQKKNKQFYTRQFFEIKSNPQSKEKKNNINDANNSPVSLKNIQITNINPTHLNTNDCTKLNIKNIGNQHKNQTSINTKQIVQIYKNNIKHITISPINGLKMKLMQLQQKKDKKNYLNKQKRIASTTKRIQIENNEAFFHKLQNEHSSS